ncbi:hypothetical protein LP420_14940 [Massilia sp. B-10]|nr:hypothetical protein LP420_14940 [Massilia sp. B-10]
MVGAAKVGRRANILSYEQCRSPITVVDSVFAKADQTISDQQGKASTNAAMKTASDIAASYAHAQSDAAKQQLIEQLSDSVPYFGDIPTICLFAFETDFRAEKDIQAVASQVAHDVVNVYEALKSGDVITATEALLSLGAGKTVICKMVDDAVGGGIIGRTPLLGDLAKGACLAALWAPSSTASKASSKAASAWPKRVWRQSLALKQGLRLRGVLAGGQRVQQRRTTAANGIQQRQRVVRGARRHGRIPVKNQSAGRLFRPVWRWLPVPRQAGRLRGLRHGRRTGRPRSPGNSQRRNRVPGQATAVADRIRQPLAWQVPGRGMQGGHQPGAPECHTAGQNRPRRPATPPLPAW